ncbi:MAG: transcriptional repressor [Candidatus Rokubacteria bacterium]|nr:transcriptional repressor [Candidatus Rokubacteria bacterium]
MTGHLADRGFRLTVPRRAVVDVLVAEHQPLSVGEIHARLKQRSVNVVSVYRTVHLLRTLGLLRVADTSKGIQRFELAEEFTGHHHHLICQECGRVQDLDGCVLADKALAALNRQVRRAQRFRVTAHDLKLFGLCEKCA